MKNIIIGFSTRNLLGSKLIRWLDNSKFSHVYIKWHSDTYDRDIIYQASGTAINFMSTKIFSKESSIIKEISLTVEDIQFQKCMQFCIDNAGVPFGFLEILGMGYVKLLNKLGIKVLNPWRDGKKTYVCSELIGTILEEDFQIKLGLNLELDGPQELYNKLM